MIRLSSIGHHFVTLGTGDRRQRLGGKLGIILKVSEPDSRGIPR